MRNVQVSTQPSCSGKSCPALTDTVNCNPGCCKTDCSVGPWSSWSSCTKSCGGGKKSRSRGVTQNPSCGGANCPALFEEMDCNTQCCTQDCQLGAWSQWSVCQPSVSGCERLSGLLGGVVVTCNWVVMRLCRTACADLVCALEFVQFKFLRAATAHPAALFSRRRTVRLDVAR